MVEPMWLVPVGFDRLDQCGLILVYLGHLSLRFEVTKPMIINTLQDNECDFNMLDML